jgi:hypothetical protein
MCNFHFEVIQQKNDIKIGSAKEENGNNDEEEKSNDEEEGGEEKEESDNEDLDEVDDLLGERFYFIGMIKPRK